MEIDRTKQSGYIVYLITNKVTGKIYIGQSKHSLSLRWYEHCLSASNGGPWPLHRAIRKYGANNFELKIVEKTTDRSCANWLEGQWIVARKSHDNRYGYNCTYGGGVYYPTPETCQKISEALKGRVSPTKGKVYSEEERERCRIRTTGRKHSQEAIQKCRETKLGPKNPNFGKHLDGTKNPAYRHDVDTNEVLKLIGKGWTQQQVADKHGVSQSCVWRRLRSQSNKS